VVIAVPVEAAEVTARLAVVGQQTGHTLLQVNVDPYLAVDVSVFALVGYVLSRLHGWAPVLAGVIGAGFYQAHVYVFP
jgi:hypothetical protein